MTCAAAVFKISFQSSPHLGFQTLYLRNDAPGGNHQRWKQYNFFQIFHHFCHYCYRIPEFRNDKIALFLTPSFGMCLRKGKTWNSNTSVYCLDYILQPALLIVPLPPWRILHTGTIHDRMILDEWAYAVLFFKWERRPCVQVHPVPRQVVKGWRKHGVESSGNSSSLHPLQSAQVPPGISRPFED